MKTLSGIHATRLVKLTAKMDDSASMGSYQYKNQVNEEGFFADLWVILL